MDGLAERRMHRAQSTDTVWVGSCATAQPSRPPGVRWIEWRADRAPAGGAPALPVDAQTIFTLRARPDDDLVARHERLIAAPARHTLVDIDVVRDATPDVLSAIPPSQRLVSAHAWIDGSAQETLARLLRVPAAMYRLAPRVHDLADGIAVLRAARDADRKDLVVYGDGPAGWWTRPLAAQFGAPVIFGALDETLGDDAPTVTSLHRDYGQQAPRDCRELFGIVGGRALHSLSPYLHNAAHRACERPARYVPLPCDDIATFWQQARGLRTLDLELSGLTIAAPHKRSVLDLADDVDPLAARARAANTLTRRDGRWLASTADALGVLEALARGGHRVPGSSAAVVGCGGAGRAAAAGLREAGYDVTLVNRGAPRAAFTAAVLDLPTLRLGAFDPGAFDLIVHATPVGSRPDERAFDARGMVRGAVLVDLVYSAAPTRLVTEARAAGAHVVDGWNILEVEAEAQYRLMTGVEMPPGQARACIEAHRARSN